MSILTRLGKYINGFLREGVSSFGMGSREVYVDINNKTVLEKGFNSNTAVYSIIKKDATKFGSIPRYVYQITEEKAYTKLQGSLADLLKQPNKNEGQDIFFTKVRAHFKLSGEAFIWLNRGDGMGVDETGDLIRLDDEQMARLPIVEMHVIPAANIIVIQDPQDIHNISDFLLEVNGRRLRLGKPNVIHWRDLNLDEIDPTSGDHLRGKPPLVPGRNSLQTNIDASNSEVRMYQNDGARGVLTNKTLNKMSPTQKSQVEKVINAKINNNDVKGAIAALEGEWNYHNIGVTAIDLQLLEGKKMSWQELCFLFDMPYEFFESHTPYSEKQLAQIGWVSNCIMPATKQLDDELNRVLPKAFNLQRKAYIACDYWDLPEMQEVRLKKAIALAKIWAITPNQILEELGYEKSNNKLMNEQWIPNDVTAISMVQDQNLMNEISKQLNHDVGRNTNGSMAQVSANGR